MGTDATGKAWFCYMLRCRDESFYVGITNDLEDRIKEHNRGKDSEYTAKRRPVQLAWAEQHPGQQAARQREVEIKGWSRKKKLGLIAGVKPFATEGKPFAFGSG